MTEQNWENIFSHIVMTEAKPRLFENMSKFQIACRPGHRPSEHLYVLKSVFAKFQKEKKSILLTSIDLKTFFDTENAFDILNEVYSSDVKGKLYRLMYRMNENVRIKVKTPVGVTEAKDCGPACPQGSVEGPVNSSVSIGNGVANAFATSTNEIEYETVKLSPQSFMDDILKVSENVVSAQNGNRIMEELTGRKSLQINLEKSSYLIMGSKKMRKRMEKELEKSPPILCNERMKKEKVIKYLGDSVSYNLEDSVHQTIVKRAAVSRQAIYEVRTVIEDTRADRLGALDLAFNIWEKSIVPMILLNSESWISISKKSIKILDDLFHFFCRIVLRISISCPKPSYYWESGSLTFSNLILQRKIMFTFHLANLEVGSLAREIWDQQVQNRELPSLLDETEVHLHSMRLEIDDLQRISKWQMKKMVREYVQNLNRRQLLDEIRHYKKLNYDKLSSEKFERKAYFKEQNLVNSRILFRASSRLVPTILGNYPSKFRRQGRSLTCPSCSAPSPNLSGNSSMNNFSFPLHSQTHVLTECPLVSDLRAEYRPSEGNDEALALFLKNVVARHMELDGYH